MVLSVPDRFLPHGYHHKSAPERKTLCPRPRSFAEFPWKAFSCGISTPPTDPLLLGDAVFLSSNIKKDATKAVVLGDLHAPKRIFSSNITSKIHGRRQPCRGFLSYLAEKSLALECLCSFEVKIFSHREVRGRRNTGCISRTMNFLWGKRFLQNRINP